MLNIPFQLFITDLLGVIPVIIVAILLWVFGNAFIYVGINIVKKIDLKGKADDKVREVILKFFPPIARVLLVLLILDTLGIGSTLIGAFLDAISFAIAIALGLSFGEALKPFAKNIVKSILGK